MGHRLARGMRASGGPTLQKALASSLGRRRLRSAPPPRPTHPKRNMPMLRERTQSTNHAFDFAACADPCCNQPLCAPSEPELDADSEELAAAAERDMMAAKAMQDFGQLCDVLRDLHDPMLVGRKKKPGDASFNDDVALLADLSRTAPPGRLGPHDAARGGAPGAVVLGGVLEVVYILYATTGREGASHGWTPLGKKKTLWGTRITQLVE